MGDQSKAGHSSFRAAAAVCGVLIAVYLLISWLSIRGKSPTYDEPLHTLAARIALERHDYRLDFDNPPLWKYWAAMPNAGRPVKIDSQGKAWGLLPDDLVREWGFTVRTLYQTPGNDPDGTIARSRVMMLLLAGMLGVMIGWWAWRWCGTCAAISAVLLFAFDPNFLAHGPLVKNDVAIALLLLALGYCLWRLGQRATVARLAAVGLICGMACAVKFSGVLLPMIAVATLALRAMVNREWTTAMGTLSRPWSRFVGAVAMSMAVSVIAVAVIWASYGFRFSVSEDASVRLNSERLLGNVRHIEGDDSGSNSVVSRAAEWMLAHRALPEPWVNGLLVIRASTLNRPSFLLGEYSDHGWPWYYPAAVLVKTPLATLAAIVVAGVIGFAHRRKISWWALICIAVPPGVYITAALLTPAAVGLRHVLPIYPFIFIGCGCAANLVWPSRMGKILVLAIGAGLMVETLAAFPNYIPFFNTAVGGSRGGIDLLSDSNLDWGQDLPLLAQWQQAHPDRKLYLCYFGTADPAHYGIRYTNLPGGYEWGPPQEEPSAPGVVAISATHLQGVFATPEVDTRSYYAPYRNKKPIAVLGGSIYLFDFPG